MAHPNNLAKTNYDRMSRWYDLITLNSEARLANIAILQLNLQPGETLLEIGCGTGTNLIKIANSTVPSGKIIGLDISTGMLSCAREKVNRASSKNTIHLIQGDAENLPIPSGKIDAILLSFTLELFDVAGIAAVMAECQRVLAPQGRICVVGLSRKFGNTLPVRLYDWFHSRFPAWIDCQPIFIEKILSAAGFHIVTTASFTLFGLPVEIVTANRI